MRLLYLADVRMPIERANGIQTIETCHALARAGHEVTLLARPDTSSPARDPLEFYGLPAHPRLAIARIRPAIHAPAIASAPGVARGLEHWRRLRYLVAALGWTLGRRSADVVFTRDLGVASLLLRIPRSWRPPLVYESHGFAPAVSHELGTLLSNGVGGTTRKQRRLARRELRVWRLADGYVTITASLAERLRRELGDRPHVAVVPDGARVEPPGARDAVPSRGALVVGYAGHLYPWKGVDVLVDALARLPDVRGLIIGGHPKERDLARIRASVAEHRLEGRVDVRGPVAPPDVATALGAADVLVLPNRRTTLSSEATSPLKLFEYLALGKPIVVSDLPALREVVDEQVAELVPPDDAEALAAAIGRLAADPARRAVLGQRAAALAANFTWDRRAERLTTLFSSVTGTAR